MRKIRWLIYGSLLIFIGCNPAPKSVLIDSFEGKIDKETVDYGASDNSSLTVTAARDLKVCGEQSMKIEYDLAPSGYMWIARGYGLDAEGAGCWLQTPQQINWQQFNALSIQVYGANTGGVIALDVKDAGGELWRFLIDDNFTGWQQVKCRFKHFFPRGDWQPQAATVNEKLDFPIQSYQLEPRLPGQGVYYFDCVKLINVND